MSRCAPAITFRLNWLMKAAVSVLLFTLFWSLSTGANAQQSPDWTPEQCDILVETAKNITRDGLPPRQALIDRPGELDRQIMDEFDLDEVTFLRAEREKACDALFQAIVQDKLMGRAPPLSSDPAWHLAPAPFDIEALRNGARASVNLTSLLEQLAPQDLEYLRMREALAALDAGAEKHALIQSQRDALIASLERKRWASIPWPVRYLVVDIPFFDARLIDAGRTIDRWNVIVGARRTPTPSFSARVFGVTLNPDWTPPSDIVRNGILPTLRRNPGAAETMGYHALDASGAAVSVDWRQRPFSHRIVQAPGPRNALGQIKLEMPNPYAVYLHDTPNKALFAQSVRAFSHGCIRVEDPHRLALAVIAAPTLDEAALNAAIATNVNQLLPLAVPLPIFVLYRTVRLGEDGELQFAADIYGRDRRLVDTIERGRFSPLASRTPSPSECGQSLP